MKPILQQAIESHQAISERLAQRAAALRRAGFQEQVPIRQNCSLAFFHQDTATGPRFRLERKDSSWLLSGTDQVLTDHEILTALEADPLRFSTSALLRPIVQDSILPTAAYIGGPAEIGYFAQLPPLYDYYDIPVPLVIPRARFRLLDARSLAWLERLKLDASQIAHPLEDLVVPSSLETTIRPDQFRASLIEPFLNGLSVFESEAGPLDHSVQRGLARTRETVTKAVDRLTRRYMRMTTDRNETTRRRVQSLQNFLFPENMPQERFYSFVSFACKYGIEHLKKSVLAAVDAYHPVIRDIQL